MAGAWPRRHPHQAMALASVVFALAIAVVVLVASKAPATAALMLAVAPAVFVWGELFSLALGKPLVPAILDRPRGRGRVIPAPADGSGLYGPEWGDGGGGGGDGGGG